MAEFFTGGSADIHFRSTVDDARVNYLVIGDQVVLTVRRPDELRSWAEA